MTTKNKQYTNEDVARELGWTQHDSYFDTWQYGPTIDDIIGGTPDFQNDLNAAWKYVWPELFKIEELKEFNPNGDKYYQVGTDELEELAGRILGKIINYDNFALYLTNKFMEGKGWRPCKKG